MEQTQVTIVGAGPSGLALGLSLARFRIQSIILEKETAITMDPRGVYLTGDAIRILHDLGIGHEISNIGHEVHKVNFHWNSFNNKPFFTLNNGRPAVLHQALPEGLLQIQPRLELALRKAVEQSPWCNLRTGCTVVDRSSDDPPTVEYSDEAGERGYIRAEWLVGADGKSGVVRKHFLEPAADIRQTEGRYPYDGAWVAANLRITPPTRQTHPQFPLWELGYSPGDVYDLFWPKDWHFCCPPGKPTATGRIGPHDERSWRYEFRQDWDASMNAEDLFWEHITPMLTRQQDGSGSKFSNSVQFPLDCIRILRCRPYKFTHKVVNRWFHNRTVLIGDAAHVFPPFAGQGIASGLRDAHQLAWRLALLLGNTQETGGSADGILRAWALERRKSVDDAALLSMLNGMMCNNEPTFWVLALLRLHTFLDSVPFLPSFPDLQGVKERQGFQGVVGGFSLKGHNGGARLAQIYVQSSTGKTPFLSDRLLHRSQSAFTILVISMGDDHEQLYNYAKAAVESESLDPAALSEKSIVVFKPQTGGPGDQGQDNEHSKLYLETFSPALRSELPEDLDSSYNERAFMDRLGRSTRFAVVRTDFFVYACAKDMKGLIAILAALKGQLRSPETEFCTSE